MEIQHVSGQNQMDYWLREFGDEIPRLSLGHKPKNTNAKSQGGVVRKTYAVGSAQCVAVKHFAQSLGVTEETVLLSALLLLLHKYTRQEDIAVGVQLPASVFGNAEENAEPLPQVIPLRTRPERGKLITGFVREITEALQLASQCMYSSLSSLKDDLSRNLGSTVDSLFDVMFVAEDNCDPDGQELQPDCNLVFRFKKVEKGWQWVTAYATDLYDEATIASLSATFGRVLDGMTERPESAIGALDVISEEDRTLILGRFNYTEVPFDRTLSIIDAFRAQVSAQQDHIAINLGEDTLTYRELEEQSNRVALALKSAGVRKGEFVGIIGNRSVQTIAGLLGIMKAGAAYVPIDPSYPKDRIEYMLSDSGAGVLVIDEGELPVTFGGKVLRICEISGSGDAPEIAVGPDDLAYVIYTSGTTGKPKGVMLEHRGVINLCEGYRREMELTAEDVILQFANLSFDASVVEIFSALLNGARLCMVSRDIIDDTKLFEQYVTDNRVSTAIFPPQYYIQLGDVRIAKVMTAGSETNADIIKKATRHGKYFNGYGPTENTVCSTVWRTDSYDESVTVSIGHPLQNMKIFILDGMNLCGIGVPGELCVSGVGIARGYLNRPELTAEKFIDNPFGNDRLYRTGDLARWLPDGNIEFMGRIDQQVKIRGFRIELSEIEETIRRQPGITDAAVIVSDANGEKAVFAYVVSDQAVAIDKLYDDVSHTLPYYMMPSGIMQLEALPLTPNGKLNKRALPKIENTRADGYVEPKTETEKKVTKIFGEILGCDKVGTHDSFFALGGHSLRAARLVNMLEEVSGVRLKVRDIFELKNAENISRVLDSSEKSGYASIPRAEEKDAYTVSPAQRRMYLVSTHEENGVTYNLPQVYKAERKIDTERLCQAMKELVRRHEALRTSFFTEGGEIYQRIEPMETLRFETVCETDTVRSDDEIIRSFIRPFDLGKAPLLRAKVVDRGDYQLLLFDMHHIIADGETNGILINDVIRLYRGEGLPPLEKRYRDYSEWINRMDLSREKEYWLRQFAEEPPVLELPADYSRGKNQSYSGKSITGQLPAQMRKSIERLAKEQGTTEYVILLTAFMILLQKYSRQEDIVVGTPLAGRNHRELESIAGMFVNTVALRGYPEGSKTVRSFIGEMAKAFLDAEENQRYPFEELVDALNIPRDTSRNPLFDAMFSLENGEFFSPELEKAGIIPQYSAPDIAKFDVTLCVSDKDGGYVVALEYNDALFREYFIDSMLSAYGKILSEMTGGIDGTIDAIDTVSGKEQEDILNAFCTGGARGIAESEGTVIDRFEKHAASQPDEIAVVYEDTRLTYSEFNAEVNQIAHKLRESGVKPDDFVVIMANASVEMIASIYGVLKAGGAYVPVDPHYPPERISYILDDCRPKCIVTSHADVPVETDLPVLDVSDILSSGGDISNPERNYTPRNLAYVIYTSGTTGNPKGVLIEHASLCSYIDQFIRYYGLTSDTVYLQQTYIGFDASIEELFAPLTVGGRMVVMPREKGIDLRLLLSLIEKEKVNCMGCVPLVANEMNHLGAKFDGIMLIGGSAMSYQNVDKLIANGTRIYNAYGPTEATVSVTYCPVTRECETLRVIPIGRPTDNSVIYILSGEKMCSVGMPGELCIGGSCLARGYLNRPELTEEKFTPNPFGEGRIYRSGDLARWLPDGNIEFMGRMDDQVKIRGFRIELGEIEETIRRQPGIVDAAVITAPDENGENAIYAYFVSDKTVDVEQLRGEIQTSLPDYMIPAGMMQLEALPLNQSGKLNKRALPKIATSSSSGYVEPSTPLERKVAAIFGEILGHERIGARDDFFAIGGHSLRAVRLVNLLEELSGVRLKIKDILELRTVENISRAIQAGSPADSEMIPKAEEKECYAVSPAQRRMYLVSSQEEDSILYNIPTVYKALRKLDPERLRTAISALVNRHEALRTSFFMDAGELFQRIENIQYDMEAETDRENTDDEIIHSFLRPFDLSRAPLFRAKIVDRGDYQLLLFDMHHIISDGVTTGILTDELIRLYKGEVLPPVEKQYRDYSEWINAQDLSRQKDYWLRRFGDELPVLELPTDRPRGRVQSYVGRMDYVQTGEGFREKLRLTASALGTTDYVVALSAFMLLLQKYTRQDDIVIGAPIAGRSHRELESMAGMFVNTVALRGYPNGAKTVRDFIMEIQQTFLDAEENQDYPFEELVEALHIPRDTSHNPLFDVMFDLETSDGSEADLTAAEILPVEVKADTSKFDITLTLVDSEPRYLFSIEYNDALYDWSFISGLLASYEKVVDELSSGLDLTLDEIEFIPDNDRDLILSTFSHSDCAASATFDGTVIEKFEAQAAATPDNIAVVFEDRRLTYSELNEAASRIARRLRETGVKPDSFVVVMATGSIEMIAAIYGVLKSGGAYVPVDPNYPPERIQYILNDCQPKCVVTAHAEVPVEIGVPIIDVSDLSILDGDGSNPVKICHPENLAYVIYTSGTTGNPKGVLIEHRSLCAYIDQFIRYFGVNDKTAYLQQTYFGFDASIEELYPALLTGGKIVILPREIGIDVKEMMSLIEKEKVNMISCAPVLANEMNHAGGHFNGILILGGSAMSFKNIDRLLANGTEVYNTYGPTEATVCASYYRVTQACEAMHSIPIGKPIATAQIYLLHENCLCGIGAPGELCIAGTGIARGYLHQPELTDEKFVPNPFGEGKLYRSGDLARWMPDGNIEFMGRIDDQVKIRGFRIELGEIEETIRRQPGVTDAAVIVAKDESGENAIYAYIVSENKVELEKLRESIGASLPYYMMPSGMMQLPELPLTANGKLNKRALPKIEAPVETDSTAPVSGLEKFVLGVWKRILGKEHLSVKSHFFESGGNSLNMLTVIAELKERGFRLKVKELQSHPTVEKLCAEVLAQQETAADFATEDDAEEFVVEKYDNSISSVTSYYDNLSWDEYDCFFRPISIICESFSRSYFDIVTMNNSFYTMYGIGDIFDAAYINGEDDMGEKYFNRFFDIVLQDKLRVKMEKVLFTSAEEMHRLIKESIDRQCPVLVPMNSGNLVYSQGYKSEVGNHAMIIKGYDSQKERYMILDNLHVDNGSSTVYKDFFIAFDTLYEGSVFYQDYAGYAVGDKGYHMYTFCRTERGDETPYTEREALLDHIRLISDMESGICPYRYLEEYALYTLEDYETHLRNQVRSGEEFILEPEIEKRLVLVKSSVQEIYRSNLQDRISPLLFVKFLILERHLNMKSTYFKSLNSLLKKCGMDEKQFDELKRSEEKLDQRWQEVKQFMFMIASQEEVEEKEVAAAIQAAKEQESAFRRRLIQCGSQIAAHRDDEKQLTAQREAKRRGYFLNNLNHAQIGFEENNIRIELEPDKLYSLWKYEDDAPKIGKYVETEDWEVSATVLTDYEPEENRFQDGFVIYLEKSSKFLFGVLKGDVTSYNIEIQCPELEENYGLFGVPLQADVRKVALRVRKKGDNLHFEYREDSSPDWVTAKTLLYRSKVECVAVQTRDWVTARHVARFEEVRFSW